MLFTFFSISTFAGTISGTVTDAKDGSALSGVVVTIKNSSLGAQTDSAGHYLIKDVADGTYQVVVAYVTYKQQMQTVTVTGDATLDIRLEGEGQHLSNVNVRSSRVTRTEVAVLSEIRKSNSIVSGIGAAQIAKTMDRNAADVVKRIPGVTIQDDRFITIRGLADRYNTVWLNDAGAPSSEVDKKAFSFDLIPSGLIDRILIFKTPSPELPGDFAGGMVKIYTSSLPAKTEYTLGVQGSYRSGSTGSTFNYTPGGSTDWLGYDNGSRNIPAGTPAYFSKTDSNISAITKAFGNKWIIRQKTQAPDLRVSFSAANVFNAGSSKIGNTLGVSYANTATNYNIRRSDWDTSGQEGYRYNDQQSINKVNLAVMDNLAFVNGNNKIEFRNLYNEIGQTTTVLRVNVPDSAVTQATNQKAYLIGYENRKTYTSQLSGTHHNTAGTTRYNWTLGYTDLVRNQPDLRRITYAQSSKISDSGAYKAEIPPGSPDLINGGGRYFAYLHERVYSFNHQFSQTIKVGRAYSFDVSAGNYLEYKKRTFDAREFGYTIKNQYDSVHQLVNGGLSFLPLDQIFADQNVGGTYNFRMEDGTSFYDHYNASNTLIASFLSLNLPVGKRIKVVGGARYEYNRQHIKGYQSLDTLEPITITKFLLPSINVTYNISAKHLLRLAYGETLNRPEFREAAPAYFYDFDLRAGITGALFSHSFDEKGDTLGVARIQNVDARWEWYPTAGEVIQVGAYYKTFKNPIQLIIVPGSGVDSKAFTYVNGISAKVGGVEIDVRKNLLFLDNSLGTKFFNGLTLVGNASISRSQLIMDPVRVKDVIAKGPLQNQSNYVVNAGLYYQTDTTGWQGSLLYNVYSPRLYAVGTVDNPSIGELAFHSLDFSLSKTIARHYIINVGVQNLLNQQVRFVEDINIDSKFDSKIDKPYNTWTPGRYFTLGVKIRF